MYTSQFQTMQPDYSIEEIDFRPEKSMNFSIKKRQTSYKLIGNRICAFNLSDFHDASFSFSFQNLTETQKNTLLDIYADEYKANGQGKTIVFSHPIYNEKFVCKFSSALSDSFDRNARYSHSIGLSIIGTDRNLLSVSSWTVGSSTATGFTALGESEDLDYDSVWDYDDILDYSEVL